jgi:hypothetical protein
LEVSLTVGISWANNITLFLLHQLVRFLSPLKFWKNNYSVQISKLNWKGIHILATRKLHQNIKAEGDQNAEQRKHQIAKIILVHLCRIGHYRTMAALRQKLTYYTS